MERWQIIEASGHTYECVDHAAYRAAVNDESLPYPSNAATVRGLDWMAAEIIDCQCATAYGE